MNSRLQSRKNFSLNGLLRTRYFFYCLVVACVFMVWTWMRRSDKNNGLITNAGYTNNKLRGWNAYRNDQKNGFWFGPDVPAFVSSI